MSSTPQLKPDSVAYYDTPYEQLYLVLGTLFITAFIFSNLVTVTMFMAFNPFWWFEEAFVVPIGVVTYPLTFLVTDLLSEFFGRHRTNRIVWMGILMNLVLLAFIYIGISLPLHPATAPVELQSGEGVTFPSVFHAVAATSPILIVGSILAFIFAQFTDVFLFSFWKNLTKGKYLWLRNNGSTLVSQFIDTLIITTALFLTPQISPENKTLANWLNFVMAGYFFKFCFAILDTFLFYGAVGGIKRFLKIQPAET